VHHWHIIKEAQKKGAKVVVIDAYKSRTAKEADWHIAPKPSTDGALAMAVIHSIIEQGLVDQDYVDNYTEGFDDLKAHSQKHTPEWAEAITGIPADDIRKLARELATAQPAAIRIGVGLERHNGGGQTIRAVTSIPALTGAWRHVGGGITQFPVWEHPYKFDVICRPDWIPDNTQVVNILQLGRALTGETELKTPIKSLMVWNTNPVTQSPEADKIVEGLMREDIFQVSADHFITDTASYADIILPAAMGAEMEDIILSWGHMYLTYNSKCVDAPGEALSNNEIFRRLSALMGYDEDRLKWSDSECLENFVDWDAPACEGIDLDYLREHGYARINVGTKDDRCPHKEGNFPTPTGKCHFKVEGAKNFVAPPFRQMYEGMQPGQDIDPLPDYLPPNERPETNPELAKKYPLNIITPKSHAFLNSCYGNMESQQKAQGEQFLLISEADAQTRGIKQGETVRVFNERGAFEGVANITDDVSQGVVVATLGYWRQLNQGTVNVTSSANLVEMGNAPTFFDNLVQVEAV
jgi:anaerobic selenocysteine-containing dehydrogenase